MNSLINEEECYHGNYHHDHGMFRVVIFSFNPLLWFLIFFSFWVLGCEREHYIVHFVYRHKCSACYKQYKKKEHLIEHMRVSYHSVHQPRCGVCLKHCKSFESLREHLMGEIVLCIFMVIYHNTISLFPVF